ncbi:hypothetical protein BJV77DRAFT_961457 [Russula vinacea]|nr:hypothetical protein BJV77DRAFT_961457 [Russula vinacea]
MKSHGHRRPLHHAASQSKPAGIMHLRSSVDLDDPRRTPLPPPPLGDGQHLRNQKTTTVVVRKNRGRLHRVAGILYDSDSRSAKYRKGHLWVLPLSDLGGFTRRDVQEYVRWAGQRGCYARSVDSGPGMEGLRSKGVGYYHFGLHTFVAYQNPKPIISRQRWCTYIQ